MSDSDPALVAVKSCGCVTAAESSNYPNDVRDFYLRAADTRREVRRVTVAQAREMLSATKCWGNERCNGGGPDD